MPVRSSVVLSALGLLLASSCTLTRTSVDKCTQNADCRDAFGVGRICGGDGLCALAPANPRCTTTFPADVLTRPESYPGVLLIGSLEDRSVGAQQQRENAVALAAMDVNEKLGVDGHLFGVVFCDIAQDTKYDSLTRTDAAVADALYLSDVIGASVIVGPSASNDALAVYDALDGKPVTPPSRDVVIISPAATSPELTGYDVAAATDAVPGLLWRTAPPDTLQGTAIVDEMQSMFPTVKDVAIIEETGPYGDALTQVFTQGFTAAGGKTVPSSFATSTDRDADILAAASAGTSVVLFISSQTTDAVAFLNGASTNQAYTSKTLFLTDSAANNDLLTGTAQTASKLYPNVIGSRPSVPSGPTYQLFSMSFTIAYKVDPATFSFVPHAYDAAWLAFYGMAGALRYDKTITGTAIARKLRHISDGSTPIAVTPENWQHIIDVLGANQTLNLVGASGTLDYDPVTEETTGLVDIWDISKDGSTIDTVTTIDPTK